MKSRFLAAFALFGALFSPAIAGAADGCLGSETITEFKSLSDGTVLLIRGEGEEYKVKFVKNPNNMEITESIKTSAASECLAAGDTVVMRGQSGYSSKYKVASVEPFATTAAAPTE